MDKNKKKGFTLVELIVVLAILAILAAMLVPALTGYIDKANEKKVIATARQYYVAAQTVVSEAYANGDEIKVISYYISSSFEGKSVIINNNGVDETIEGDSKYMDDFIKLCEFSKDTKNVGITGQNGKVTEAYISIGNKMVHFDNGEFSVYSFDD